MASPTYPNPSKVTTTSGTTVTTVYTITDTAGNVLTVTAIVPINGAILVTFGAGSLLRDGQNILAQLLLAIAGGQTP
jgi:hypothetical protein